MKLLLTVLLLGFSKNSFASGYFTTLYVNHEAKECVQAPGETVPSCFITLKEGWTRMPSCPPDYKWAKKKSGVRVYNPYKVEAKVLSFEKNVAEACHKYEKLIMEYNPKFQKLLQEKVSKQDYNKLNNEYLKKLKESGFPAPHGHVINRKFYLKAKVLRVIGGGSCKKTIKKGNVLDMAVTMHVQGSPVMSCYGCDFFYYECSFLKTINKGDRVSFSSYREYKKIKNIRNILLNTSSSSSEKNPFQTSPMEDSKFFFEVGDLKKIKSRQPLKKEKN